MKILKYPQLDIQNCAVCGTSFLFTNRDYKRHKCIKASTDENVLQIYCPVCGTCKTLGNKDKEEVGKDERPPDVSTTSGKLFVNEIETVLKNNIYNQLLNVLTAEGKRFREEKEKYKDTKSVAVFLDELSNKILQTVKPPTET